ncbi:CpsD/CapB family tyrosine-protein kinase [Maritimibacter dapengensis]|uniref:CpsD/CapB family tyrosine-protein kinase n=1 Tax=Maritimibacter dapengensis TaxID=2836868 RepID=A0ABS6T3H7_9RHOB|nr:CpsD/CapB family tyrosine-protein kinase [Maritimibacter dapengensis]MBV7379810.1 CpsD/CapB family tyrosine-protein kinase [Maritimibacter dapengensis]
MEKLQSAIEKARLQRETANASDAVKTAKKTTVAPKSNDLTDIWTALEQVSVSSQVVRDNHLHAQAGGHEAAPFDMLRTRILQQTRANGWKRVAIVSPDSGCGKTTMAANLAFSFGRRTDFRTMVLDLDLRRPQLASKFGLKPQHTMADVLQGRLEFSGHGVRLGDNVALGLNNGPVENSSEILQSETTKDALTVLQDTYQPDLMLFDMPPLQAADDNFGFLNNVDCAILLAQAEHTTIKQIDVAERQIAELTNVLGVVLNQCRYTDDAYGYGYY